MRIPNLSANVVRIASAADQVRQGKVWAAQVPIPTFRMRVPCGPCHIRLIPGSGPFIGPRFVLTQHAKFCVPGAFPSCGPCIEMRGCSLVPIGHFYGWTTIGNGNGRPSI